MTRTILRIGETSQKDTHNTFYIGDSPEDFKDIPGIVLPLTETSVSEFPKYRKDLEDAGWVVVDLRKPLI